MEIDILRSLIQTISEESFCNDLFYEKSNKEYLRAIAISTESVDNFLKKTRKPFSGIKPAEIQSLVAEIDLDQKLSSYEELISEVERIYVRHATAFHLPEYIAHLNCPVVIPALAAEVLISAINSSQDTYDQSAGGTFIERKLIDWTNEQIGFPSHADGVFTSGGSQSNLMGLLLARDNYALENSRHNIRESGLNASISRYRILVSEKAHFSIKKSACVLGLGEQSIVTIPTDDQFRMDVNALRSAILHEREAGNIPFVIVATAGTTDFGNIDPLQQIADVAKEFNCWLHVDAAYGCGLLLTDLYRHLLNGIECADSVTIDYHKSFFQPVSSSALVVRNRKHLNLVKHHADYLNPQDEGYDDQPAQVNKSPVQTTRRFDALKLWFTLRYMGREKLGEYTNIIIQTARSAAQLIDKDDDLELICSSDLGALLFRYTGNNTEKQLLDDINRKIKSALFDSGEIVLASTKVNGKFYLKFTIINPLTTVHHIGKILNKIKYYGQKFS